MTYPHHYGQSHPPAQQGWIPPGPPAPPAPPPAPKNGLGIAALVLGITGLLLAFVPLVGVIAWPLVILGLVLGILGILRANRGEASNRGVAIAGVACSAIGLLVCTLWVIGLAATGPEPPKAASPGGEGGQQVAGQPQTEFQAGQTADLDGLQITVQPLAKQRDAGQAVLCSKVTYVNNSGEERFFNGGFDWKLQGPDGVIKMTTLLGKDLLSAGQLAPGGTVTGNVCFDVPAKKGDYSIITSVSFWSADEVRWKTTI